MRDAVAETCRFIGAVLAVLGCIFILVAAGIAAAPYIAFGITWMVANYGLATFAAVVAFSGFALFRVGEMIRPWKGPSSSISSNHSK